MKKRKLIVLAIAFLIIIFVAAYFVFFKLTKEVAQAPTPEPEIQPQTISIEDKKITDNTAPFEIDITYPYIEGQDGFNNFVENIINSETASFKQISLENDAAVKEIDPESYEQFPRSYALNIGYDKGRLDENIVSVVVNIYNFTGGAHGAAYFKPVNWDFRTNKEIKLADIFSETPDYLQKISDYAKPILTQEISKRAESDYSGWVDEGASPKEENFSVFLLSDAYIDNPTITFYFAQYQVAAYALGDFKVTMPLP